MTDTRILVFDEAVKSKYNLDAAAKFGEIVYVFSRGDSRESIFSDDFLASIKRRLDYLEFNPAKDVICATGSFIPMLFLVITAFDAYDGVNILLFNAIQNEYVLKRVERTKNVKKVI